MNNKNLFIYFGVALLAILLVNYLVISSATEKFGSTLTYSSVVGRMETFNLLNDVVDDLKGLRTPLSGVLSSSTSWNPGTVTSPSGQSSTSLNMVGAALGDFVLVSLATTSQNAVLNGYVSVADTVVVTLTSATTSVDIATTTLYVRVLPQGSFAAPAALESATTTTP